MRLELHLAPNLPFLQRKNDFGGSRKWTFGPFVFNVLKWLSRLKGLRGTLVRFPRLRSRSRRRAQAARRLRSIARRNPRRSGARKSRRRRGARAGAGENSRLWPCQGASHRRRRDGADAVPDGIPRRDADENRGGVRNNASPKARDPNSAPSWTASLRARFPPLELSARASTDLRRKDWCPARSLPASAWNRPSCSVEPNNSGRSERYTHCRTIDCRRPAEG